MAIEGIKKRGMKQTLSPVQNTIQTRVSFFPLIMKKKRLQTVDELIIHYVEFVNLFSCSSMDLFKRIFFPIKISTIRVYKKRNKTEHFNNTILGFPNSTYNEKADSKP